VFARKADDDLASFARKLDEMVTKNKDKKACGTVVLLTKKDEVSGALEKIAEKEKLQNVPLTVAQDGATGPKKYQINKDVTFTVVVYDDGKKVTASFAFEKLDAKNQDEALAAFAKVLGVDAPKSEKKDAGKKDEKKPEKGEKKEAD
jgi:hypothetical protein